MIEVKNLNVSIGNKTIFSNVNFLLKEKCLTALCGMNGSGKSTLLSVMSKVYSNNLKVGGQVLLNNTDVLKSKKSIAKDISYLVQNEFNIWDITATEFIEDGRFIHHKWYESSSQSDKKIIEETLKLLNLEELQNRSIKSLSGGEYQRLRIARSLVQETDYIFMDEPLTALDMNFQKEILILLKELCANGKTIFISLHDLNLASIFADEIIMLKKDRSGCITGNAEKLMCPEIIEKVYDGNYNFYTHPVNGKIQIY